MTRVRACPSPAPHRLKALAVGAALLAAAGCSDGATGPPGDGGDGATLRLQEVAAGLDALTYLTSPAGDDRIFVLEQPGTVRLLVDGEVREEPWLDISDAVASGGERGLLGLAFHPDFAENGRFYLDFTVVGGAGGGTGDTRVVEYTVDDPSADRAGSPQADTLLAVAQPFSNHNGGMLAFGPDGMLYVALGDGGSGGDPEGNGQDSTTVLGSLARLDPDGGPSSVPPDNPFPGGEDGHELVWAYGLRNPWRFAFDPPTGTVFVADVGQSEVEEVNAVDADAAGLNFGWNVMEGSSCFQASDCDREGLTLPILDYPNGGDTCSVTGGFVYRGSDVPELEGRYLFSDLCAGFLRSFRLEGGEATDVVEHDLEIDGEPVDAIPGSVTSFGTDADGELHVLTGDGTIYRISGAGG